MNQRRHETIVNNRIGRRRTGFSIIEVLTSIVVAMIGVFGVMILIPFAVKQAQTGLDSDAAVILGLNAYAKFEIEGYNLPTNWGVYRGTTVPEVTAYSPYEDTDLDNDGTIDGPDLPQILSIDPLGIIENGGATLADRYAQAWFPFNRFDAAGPAPTNPYPPNLAIRPAILGTPTGAVMGIESARRFMRTTDDLVFGESLDDLLGPKQIFDRDQAGDELRRQSRGRLSWSAIVVPFKPDSTSVSTQRWSYKMYILVYKDRPTFFSPNVEDKMATSMVINTGIHSPVSNVALDPDVEFVEGVLHRDDWVMLINRDSAAEVGFQRQLAFYRVVSVADADPGFGTLASLTLDGSDFTFTDPSGTRTYESTFVVHLKNVVGVYERTFEPEFESTWTVN